MLLYSVYNAAARVPFDPAVSYVSVAFAPCTQVSYCVQNDQGQLIDSPLVILPFVIKGASNYKTAKQSMTDNALQEDLQKVGKLVSTKRTEQGLSVVDFAKKLELTAVTLYSIEAARTKFHSKTANKLVKGLDLTGDEAELVVKVGAAVNRHKKRRGAETEAPAAPPATE